MRRTLVVVLVVVGALALAGVVVGAYQAGVQTGAGELSRIGEGAGSGEVVRVVGWRPGFFPFGLLLFPFLLLGTFALARAAFWGPRWYRGPGPYGGPGPCGPGGPVDARLQEWHRHAHESEASGARPGDQ